MTAPYTYDAPKPPWPLWGCLGLPRRGDSVAKATDLFTIPSSLFTKKISLFHIGWYFEEVPAVNPSVKNQRFLPAPFGKGAFGCAADTGHRRGSNDS